MSRMLWIPLLPLSAALLIAADQPWKDKPAAQWTDDDARLILSDSPWVSHVQPVVQSQEQVRQTRRQSRPPVVRIGRRGIPRIGGARFPSPPRPAGGGSTPGGRRNGNGAQGAGANQPPELTLRWESARPVRDAELKTRDNQAPSIDEKKYAIAVYGVPVRLAPGESQSVLNKLKSQAVLRRDGKKDIKPSKVLVVDRQGAPVYVFLFNRSMKKPEITEKEPRVEFDAQIGRLKFSESFFPEDMVIQGKLEM